MDLTSAPVPALAPDDHVRGPADAPLIVMYADFACPHCAVAHLRLQQACATSRCASRSGTSR